MIANNRTYKKIRADIKFNFALLLFIMSYSSYAQTEINSAGNWDDSGIWVSNEIGDNVSETVNIPNGVGSVTIRSGFSYEIGEFTMRNTNTLIVNGTLNVGNSSNLFDMICFNSDEIIVNSGGELVIWGNLDVKNNLNLTVNGTMSIKGNVLLDNNAALVVSGSLDVDGDFDSGTGTTLTLNSGGTMSVVGDFSSDGITAVVNAGTTLSVGGNFLITTGSLSGDGDANFGGSCTGPDEFCNGEVLPVELISFECISESNGVLLKWITASELNNDYFALERSFDGLRFLEISKVNGIGTTNEITEYHYKDEIYYNEPVYYRLRQVDFDGAVEISRVIMFRPEIRPCDKIEVFPNPTSSILNIELGCSEISVGVKLLSMQGKILKEWGEIKGTKTIDITQLPEDLFVIQFSNGQQMKVLRTILR